MLAALAALAELTLSRFVVPALYEDLPETTLLTMLSWGTFLRNLSGLCGLGALVFLLTALVLDASFLSLTRRSSLGFFGLLVVAMSGALLLFPEEWFMPYERLRQGVLAGAVAAHGVVVNVGFAAGDKLLGRARRGALWFFALLSLSALVIVALIWMPLTLRLQTAGLLRQALHRVGEVLYLGGVCFAVVAAYPRGRSVREGVAMVVPGLIAALIGVICVGVRTSLGSHFGQVWYGAFRLEWLLDREPLLYVPIMSVGIGTAVGGMMSAYPSTRMSAAALGLMVASGFMPPAADRLVMLVLGIVLLVASGASKVHISSETAD